MADFGFEFWKRVDDLLGDTKISTMAECIGMNYQTVRNQRSLNRYPKKKDIECIAEYLKTTSDYLIHGNNDGDSISFCDEAVFVQQNPEARTLVRAIMEDPSLLYPLSALVTRRSTVEGQEKQA